MAARQINGVSSQLVEIKEFGPQGRIGGFTEPLTSIGNPRASARIP
jgi:hypothetical protein